MFKNEKGFTLIEMLVVLLIISVLMILIIPNLGEKSEDVHEKGCDALVSVVQAQVDLYILEEGEKPETFKDLTDKNYITEEQTECSGDKKLILDDGKVRSPLKNETE